MKTKISLKRAIQASVLILVFLSLISVWPMKLVRPWQYLGDANEDSTSIVAEEGTILQQFIPVNDYLRTISFYVYNEDLTEAAVYVRLFDCNLNVLDYSEITLNSKNTPGLCTVSLRGDWKGGEIYYFSIECPGTELLISRQDGVNLDVRYGYRVFFTRMQYLLIGFGLFLFGAGVVLVTELIFRKKKERKVDTDYVLRLPAAVLVTGASLFAAYHVFTGRLASELTDVIFYEIGIALFLTFSLYCLFHKRPETEERVISFTECIAKLPGILQSLAFAGVMLGCVRYVNALYLYGQKTASNLTLACFALAILCSFTGKELFNIYQLVYVVLASVSGIIYCIGQNTDVESLTIARGTVIVWFLWGMILLNVLYHIGKSIREKKHVLKKVSPVYTVMLLLLLLVFIRNRNGKTWPVVLLLLWGLFACRVLFRDGREQYLSSFVKGVFIHFTGISIYAWLHRPFHFYMHTRYSGVFHTVTSAAVYDSFVLVLALGVFLLKYAKTKKLSSCLTEIWVLGLSAGFLLLTASRTGLFAAGIVGFLLWIVTSFTEYKDGILRAFLRLGIVAVITAGFFVGTFTACRIIPAVCSDPMTYEIEWFRDSIKKGEEWNSFRYVTVRKFLAVFDAKLTYYDKKPIPTGEGTVQKSDNGSDYYSPELTDEKEGIGGNADYSNGRMDIYKKYLSLLDWKGHKDVSVMGDNGKMIAHAHNAYIQVAYDFGIGAGIYFLIFCVVFGIRSILYYRTHRGETAGIIPVTIIGIFGVCGLVEWVMLPYIPTGFALFFVLTLLVPKIKETKEL